MTSEEKQVISKLRESIEYDKKHRIETIYDEEVIELRNNIELMLNLIEKLQKENEELNKQYDQLTQYFVKNHVAKDKIRELLEEHNIKFGKETISMSEQGAFGFMLSIKELLKEE